MLTSFLFDCGNSGSGPIGFSARVIAETRERGLELLREALPKDYHTIDDGESNDPDCEGIEYINV